MNRPVQYFSDEYLERCKGFTADQVLEFQENYQLMHEASNNSIAISVRVPEPLLNTFKSKCQLKGLKYQTQIKKLMKEWVLSDFKEE